MKEVEGTFCPFLDQVCIKRPLAMSYRCSEYRSPSGPCQTGTSQKHFCIDDYEWPNQAGETPVVMKSWYEARDACAGVGKRLCSQDEWTLACEGPEHLPYPYGYVRDATACNIDKAAIGVDEEALKRPDRRDAEVARLWQGEPSGSRERCVSPFGVHDMTGNVDEWTRNETGSPHQSALKGGYWSWVRGRCRAVTAGHEESFRYYQIGFRCCSDPLAGTAAPAPPIAAAEPVSPRRSAPPMRTPEPPRPPAPRPEPSEPAPRVSGQGMIAVRASEHRVFVDGHVIGNAPGVMVVECGSHVVKIGHDGREQTIDVPCGGRIDVRP
jgi:formylglycine-generating enzyme